MDILEEFGGKKLNSTGPLHGEGSSKKSLRLFFDDGSTDIIVEKTSDNIDLENNEGVVGFNSQNHPLKYQKIFFHKGKHSVDVLRPLALSRGIAVIEDAAGWAILLEDEARKDLTSSSICFQELDNTSLQLKTSKFEVPNDIAIETAKIAAETILTTNLPCLEGKTIQDLVSWKPEDELLVSQIRESIRDPNCDQLPYLDIKDKFYARHIIAASVLESLGSVASIENIFIKMKKYLVEALGKVETWSIGSNISTS